jgi:hypothetical protein
MKKPSKVKLVRALVAAHKAGIMKGAMAARSAPPAAPPMPAGGAPMGPPPGAGGPPMGMKKGGEVESKSDVKKEISFMRKHGASKSMIAHEQAEARGEKKHIKCKGGTVRMAHGGRVGGRGDGIAQRGRTKGRMV